MTSINGFIRRNRMAGRALVRSYKEIAKVFDTGRIMYRESDGEYDYKVTVHRVRRAV